MSNTKRKVRRKLKIGGLAVIMLCVSVPVSLCSSLFLRTYNVSLNHTLQTTQNEITTLSAENDSLEITIQTLSARDRVLAIAEENGLASNQENVSTVVATEGNE